MEKASNTDEVYFSYNEKIINKNEQKDIFALANGWKHVAGTIELLLKVIQAGIAYSAWFKDGQRKNSNFVGTNLVSIDIDGTNRIDSTINHDFSRNHLTALYTTCSHTAEEHRFRLIFKLERVIESPYEYRSIVRSLQLMYSGDSSAVDPARIFYGNNQAQVLSWNKQIPNIVIDDLIKLNPTPILDSLVPQYGLASTRSEIKISHDKLLKTSRGETIKFGDAADRTPVYCPYHLDKNSSAFIGIKNNGIRYLHCVRCKTTWHEVNPLDYSPQSTQPDFVETLRKIKDMALEDLADELRKLPIKADPSILHSANITFLYNKFIDISSIPNGLTFIRSRKGSGKTESLVSIIHNLHDSQKKKDILDIDDFVEDDYDDEGPPIQWQKNRSVLLIGHRQALIRSMCQRLGLNCYLDEGKNRFHFNQIDFRRRYGICLDSIKKVIAYDSPFREYDLVIIDEVEQVLAHLISSTIKDAPGCLEALGRIIRTSKSVIAMDADLGWTSFLTLNSLRSPSREYGIEHKTEIYINEYHDQLKSIDIYQLKSDLVTQLVSDVAAGKKIFISTNSKKQVVRLSAAIQSKLKNKKVISITSENSNSKPVIEFIENIKTESKKYDVVISSPSLGTGIDITFTNEEKFFDTVYGIYEALVNPHTEIDQQLSRVRHPKSVKVWVSPRIFNFETDFDVINTDLLTSNVIANTAIDDAMPIAQQVFNIENVFLRTAALIVSDQRASKNNLRSNFIEYKKRQGWSVVNLEKQSDNRVGIETLNLGKALEEQEYIAKLLNANPIDETKFTFLEESLDEQIRISESDYLSYQRMLLELFYCRQIDSDMIKFDDRWNRRKQFALFKRFFNSDDVAHWKQTHSPIPIPYLKKNLSIIRQPESIPFILRGLFSCTPFYKNGEFNVDIEFKNSDLKFFLYYMHQIEGCY